MHCCLYIFYTFLKKFDAGERNGAVAHLQTALGKLLVYFACRRHMYEVVCGGVFEEAMGVSSGPECNLFKQFRKSWPAMDHTAKYEPGIKGRELQRKLRSRVPEVTQFLRNQLEVK